jgi:hypothetical protein
MANIMECHFRDVVTDTVLVLLLIVLSEPSGRNQLPCCGEGVHITGKEDGCQPTANEKLTPLIQQPMNK